MMVAFIIPRLQWSSALPLNDHMSRWVPEDREHAANIRELRNSYKLVYLFEPDQNIDKTFVE